MAWTVTLLSPVVGDGTTSPYRPKLSDDFPALQWSDITGQATADQPGDPSLVVLDVTVDDPLMFDGNPDYFVMESVENEPEISEG